MTKFIQDSYNGLYKVLLKPYVPRGATIVALIAGVIIGLFWAYVISPAIYYDADPSTLHQSWQDEWVKLIADRNALSNFDVGENVTYLLSRVDNPLAIVDRLLATPGEEANFVKLQAIRPFAETAELTAVSAPSASALGNVLPYILGPLVVGILFILGAIIYGMFIKPNLVDPVIRRIRGEKASAGSQAMRAQVQASKQAEASSRSDFTASAWGQPLMQRMSTYILGHGQYDDSFSIEDEQKRFLGECGAEVSETIGVGEPAKATAVEVWLFDKDDFVRTVTKIFCSEHAFNDPGLRAKLDLRGDLVLAQPGATAVLETATLRIQARVVDVEYGPGPMPTHSYFQKLTLELAAWHKDGTGMPALPTAPTTAAAPVLTGPAAPVVSAPPPAPQQPVSPVAARPLPTMPTAPPPVARPPVTMPLPPEPAISPPLRPPVAQPPLPDDDPFGGAADF